MPDNPSEFSSQTQLNDGIMVTIDSDIDFERSPKLRDELLAILKASSPARLVIDLANVPYIDSSGLATFVEALQFQRQTQRKLVLCGLQPKVESMFKIARLDMVFTITQDPAKAAEA